MQNNTDNFDQMVKAMLQDAEVAAPSGAWESVAGKLAGTSSAPAASRWWWSAAACLAVAASLACVLVFRTGSSQIHVPSVDISNALAQVEIVEIAEPVNVVKKAVAINQVISVSEVLNPVVVEEEEPQEQVAEPVKNNVQQPSKSSTQSTKAQWTDPFAELEREESRVTSGSPVSISASGTLGGNDSDFASVSANTAMRAPGSGSIPTSTCMVENSVSNYGIPLSLGLGVNFAINESLSIGTGLTWSMLSRTFSGTFNEVENGVLKRTVSGDFSHTCQYIGIPLNVYYNLIKTETMHFYAYGGCSAEFCLGSKYSSYGTADKLTWKAPVKGIQGSAVAGIGVEFKVSEHVGLYLDPGARLYFSSDGQPKSVRTDKPFMLNFEAGLRFNLK